MENIILAMARREGVISVESITKKQGFKKEDVIKVLNSLAMRGKLTFVLNLKVCASSCGGCPLNKFCITGEHKKWN